MNSGAGPDLSVAECVELARLGAYVELSAATCMGGHGPNAADVVRAIGAIGPDMVVLSTDYGWTDELPRPATGLHSYVDALWKPGAAEPELRRMACETRPDCSAWSADSRHRRTEPALLVAPGAELLGPRSGPYPLSLSAVGPPAPGAAPSAARAPVRR